MSTDEQPNRPTSRRAGPTRRLRRACPTFQRPPLVLLPGGLNLTDQAWAELQQAAPDAGVDPEPWAEQLRTLSGYADAIAGEADCARTLASDDYDRQRALARVSHQRRAAALASIGEAVSSASPVTDEELVALIAVAQSENDDDHAALSAETRRLAHRNAAFCKLVASQLAALVDHLDEVAHAMSRGRRDQNRSYPDGSPPPDGQAS
jgi:hypothetical protein